MSEAKADGDLLSKSVLLLKYIAEHVLFWWSAPCASLENTIFIIVRRLRHMIFK